MTLKLRSASNEALRKVQSLSVMITSSLSPYSPDKWVALAMRLTQTSLRYYSTKLYSCYHYREVFLRIIALPY
jgi:uncharacterized membrane protein YdjX (TVP38/TMEM64 family)